MQIKMSKAKALLGGREGRWFIADREGKKGVAVTYNVEQQGKSREEWEPFLVDGERVYSGTQVLMVKPEPIVEEEPEPEEEEIIEETVDEEVFEE